MAALGLTLDRRPELRNPALIAAFTGWSDGGEAASAAVRWLIRRLPGQRFASIDAEHFHIFTTTRPTVRLQGGERRITWPAHDAFFHTDPEKSRDLILLIAKEPEVRWRTYCESVLELALDMGVTTLMTLGAFLGDTIHSRPVPLSGYASTPPLSDRLTAIDVSASNYEGPTGITSLLNYYAQRAEIPSASLWAAVPHYLPTTANPKAALALVRGVAHVLELELDLRRLEAAAAFFLRQVDQAIASDRRATGMLRALERRAESDEEDEEAASSGAAAELPSAEQIISDLESFLRNEGGDDQEV